MGRRHLEYEVGCVASGRSTIKIIEKSGEWRVKMLESFATHICICSPAGRTYYEKKSDLAGPRRRFNGVVIVKDDASFYVQVRDTLTSGTVYSTCICYP